MSFAAVDLGEVVADVLADMEAEVSAEEAIVDVTALPKVSGSREELKVLFQNLIGNALKYHEPGVAPRIRIFDSSDPDEPELRITVADSGIGVSPESHERIFEMFKRLHSEKEYSGNGLGLAICRRIAIAHGGNIFVKSEPGNGASFIVQLHPADHRWRRDEP